MNIGNTLYVFNRYDWRNWLLSNFDKEKEIWLLFPNKSTGKQRLPYNDAVEEALCFGWIDSTIKSYDDVTSAQRFTPRNPKSGYSQQNKERLNWLLKNNLIHPSLTEKIKTVLNEEFVFPDDIIEAIKAEPEAWKNYINYSAPYKRIRIAYIDSVRYRPEEFEKRLRNFISKTKDNKIIGYGGIEKHF